MTGDGWWPATPGEARAFEHGRQAGRLAGARSTSVRLAVAVAVVQIGGRLFGVLDRETAAVLLAVAWAAALAAATFHARARNLAWRPTRHVDPGSG